MRDQQQVKIQNFQAQLRQHEHSNFSSQSTRNHKQNELDRLKAQTDCLSQSLHRFTVQKDDASVKFEMARAEAQRCNTECVSLQKDCEAVKTSNVNLVEIQRKLVIDNERESTKYRENTNQQANAEQKLAARDAELLALTQELDTIRCSNETLIDTNNCYQQELQALESHANVLASQNNDLQRELDEFVVTDEMIRNGLDRKDRIKELKERISYNERQSL